MHDFNLIWVGVILVLNFGISWWNARACGRAWVESKALGGVIRLLVWCAAIQSAIGFSMVFLLPLLFAAQAIDPRDMNENVMNATMNLWYVTIIIPALGTGLVITIESWMGVYRDHSLKNLGRAAYNTLAEVHNVMGAIRGLGPALKSVGELFSGRGGKGKAIVLTVVIVVLALCAGSILTAVLIHHYAGTVRLPKRAAHAKA